MIALVTALLLAAQDPQVNCENPQVQQEMNYCAEQDADRADAELNTVYRSAIESERAADREFASYQTGTPGTSSEPGAEASLREAQRAWVAFREAHCRLEGYEARGGSMEPMLEAGCRAAITRARTAELRGPECPGDAEQAAINACLNRVYTRVDAALNRQWEETLRARPNSADQLRTAQRAWLAYRDAQCRSVAPSIANAEIQSSEQTLCRTRLTEARTHELADLAGAGE